MRIEELINYFPYELREPRGNDPVAITTEVTTAPWQPRHQLVRIALQSRRIETASLPPNNLVFLIDVSGSMQSPDKLPLVKQSLRLLVDQMRPQDRVAIVAYAGAAGLVLPSTSGDEKKPSSRPSNGSKPVVQRPVVRASNSPIAPRGNTSWTTATTASFSPPMVTSTSV